MFWMDDHKLTRGGEVIVEEHKREEERKENTFRETVLFVVGFVVIGLTGLLVLVVELPFAVAIGLIRNKWAMWATPRAFSAIESALGKLEEWYFPGCPDWPDWHGEEY